MDRLTLMATFVKAVELGSFSAVADELNLSPQLIGKQVKMLEQHLGVSLLHRTTRKQSLTDFGRTFYQRAKLILADMDAAEEMAAVTRGVPSGRLRINAPVTFGVSTLAPRLLEYMVKYPQVAVDLTLSNELINLVPFLDMAYQGFGDGIHEDAAAVRLFAESGLTFFVSSSFSKSFSLYGERVGALSIVGESKEESARILSQVKRVIRTNYSNPPTHGAAIVAAVLNSPELRAQWEAELAEMRLRIRGMREQMVAELAKAAPGHDFSFVGRQRGMFSYSGLTVEQVTRLRSEFGIYALDTGRICVAALNQSNIDAVTKAIVQVL